MTLGWIAKELEFGKLAGLQDGLYSVDGIIIGEHHPAFQLRLLAGKAVFIYSVGHINVVSRIGGVLCPNHGRVSR